MGRLLILNMMLYRVLMGGAGGGLLLPTVRTSRYGKNSFRFEAARVWNSLPNEIRCANNSKNSRG